MFVHWQSTNAREFSRQDASLIESAFTFAVVMQRNRNDHVGLIQRLALLHVVHQVCDAVSYVWLPFKFEDRCAQRSFIETTRSRGREFVRLTSTAADSLAPIMTHLCETQRAAFPAQCFVTCK